MCVLVISQKGTTSYKPLITKVYKHAICIKMFLMLVDLLCMLYINCTGSPYFENLTGSDKASFHTQQRAIHTSYTIT